MRVPRTIGTVSVLRDSSRAVVSGVVTSAGTDSMRVVVVLSIFSRATGEAEQAERSIVKISIRRMQLVCRSLYVRTRKLFGTTRVHLDFFNRPRPTEHPGEAGGSLVR